MKSFSQKVEGAVLVIALVFLLLLALLASTVMQTSQMEFRMAGNEQFKEEAFQLVQGVATQLSADNDNFPVTGDVGDTYTPVSAPTIPDWVTGGLTYKVERLGPMILESVPFRQGEDEASSIRSYDAAVFEVDVTYDGTAERLGKASIVHGIAVKIVASTQ